MANAQNYTTNTYCPAVGNSIDGIAIPSSSGLNPPPGAGDGQVWAIWTSPSQSATDVMNFQNGIVGPFTVTDKEGMTYFFSGGGVYDAIRGVYTATPDQIEDRNGNIVTFNIDTAGRQRTTSATVGGLTYPAGTCPSCSNTATINYTQTPVNGVIATLESGESLSCPPNNLQVNATEAGGTVFALPTSTPSNPQQYILYNGNVNPNDSTIKNVYGLVNELIYPDGGWVKYTWKMSNVDPNNPYTQSAFFTGNGMLNGTLDTNTYPQGCALKYNAPVLASRTVSFDGVTVAQTQTFTYQTFWNGWNWTSKQTQVLTTDAISGSSFLTVYNYVPGGVPGGDPLMWGSRVAPGVPVETSILYYSGNSTSTPLLRTVTKSWVDVFDLQEVDTTENGHTSKTVYCYVGTSCFPLPSLTSPFNQLQSQSEYDFSGTLIRSTNYQYQTFPYKTITYQSTSVSIPVPARPNVATVKNSSGTVVAETDYSYDGAPLGPATGVQHDDSNYGAGLTNRGNATSVTHKCFGCTDAITNYTYDITGQPASMTDPNGNKTTYAFADSPTGGNSPGQSNAYLTQVIYPKTGSTVHQESFQYNYVFGDLIQSADENTPPQITTYQYADSFDRLTQSSFPDGGVTNISYTDSPTAPSVTTCQLISGSASAACSATSPPSGWKTSVALMDGMFHTKQTQLVSDPSVDYVDSSYDGLGRKRTVSNPHRTAGAATDGTTTTAYDVLGRPILVTEQDGSTVQTAYDQTCAVNTNTLGTLVTDEAGNQRRTCTDGLGRLVEVDEPGGNVWGSAAPGTGGVTITGSEEGPVNACPPNTCLVYDSGNFSVSVNGSTVGGAGYSYGGTDTPSTIAAALANAINNDSSSPVTATASGGGISITAKTSGAGTNYSLSVSMSSDTTHFPNPSFTITPSGADLTGGLNAGLNMSTPFITLYQYDALDRLVCAAQKGSDTTQVTTCSSAPATWRPRSFAYDSLSRLLSASNPESGTITYTYDANSNLLSKTAPLPNQTQSGSTVTTYYTYDALNRLTSKTYKDNGSTTDPYTQPVRYGYDGVPLTSCTKNPPVLTDSYPIGRRTSMCDGSGATSWAHDQMGRVKQDDRFIGSVTPGKFVNYGYNADGSISFLTTPPLKTIAYTYNGAGEALQAVDTTDGINFVTNATYAAPGELVNALIGGVIHGAASFNARLQPLQIYYGTSTAPGLTGSTCPSTVGNIMHRLYNFSFGSADNGNALTIANCRDTTRTELFTYDALNRITTGQSGGAHWGEMFTTDPWGNLYNRAGITGKTNTELLNCQTNSQNELTACSHTYDPAGNMTDNGTYVYDAENRLVWTSGERYLYDGDGKRVEKCSASTPTTACATSGTGGTLYWRGTGSDTLDETDLSGNAKEEYVFFNGQRIARRDISTNAVHYYFSDHLGSHSAITDATGTSLEQDIDYYPYGGVEHDYCTACVAQNYKFTGKERDTESGNDYFGARYYAGSMGRFVSPDWAAKAQPVPYAKLDNPQSLNLYAYVGNNPLSRTDPTGHYLCNGDQCKQVAAALDAIKKAAGNDNLSKDQKAALQKVISFYGEAGKDNKVTVNTGSGSSGTNNGGTSTAKGRTTISLDLSHWDAKGANLNGGTADTEKAGSVAHEGEHGVLQKAQGMPTTNDQEYKGEQQAFQVQSYVNQGLGVTSAYYVWTPSGGYSQSWDNASALNATQIWCGCSWTPTSGAPPQ